MNLFATERDMEARQMGLPLFTSAGAIINLAIAASSSK
jgi:hypothetical protein